MDGGGLSIRQGAEGKKRAIPDGHEQLSKGDDRAKRCRHAVERPDHQIQRRGEGTEQPCQCRSLSTSVFPVLPWESLARRCSADVAEFLANNCGGFSVDSG